MYFLHAYPLADMLLHMVADKKYFFLFLADMELDMVADKEVDKVADMVADHGCWPLAQTFSTRSFPNSHVFQAWRVYQNQIWPQFCIPTEKFSESMT